MSRIFDLAWDFIQEQEGGGRVHSHPEDPGGTTKWGISQRAFPEVRIAELTEQEAKSLFRVHYWIPCHCDELPSYIAVMLADSAFNQGVKPAVRILQHALRVEVDGIVGPDTIEAAQATNPLEFINQYLSHRLLAYSEGKGVFRRGWFMRVLRLKDALARV